MKVLKFGGTSVGTVESLCNVKKIIESESQEPLIVVVSALGGITDRLIATARMAAAGDPAYLDSLDYILQRHNTVIDGLVPEDRRERLLGIVNPLLDELTNIYKGLSLLHDLSLRTLDIVVSYGERLSSAIIAHIIDGARHFDARSFIRTNTKWDKHTFDSAASSPLIHAALDEIVATPSAVAIVPGFISTDTATRNITNLGRGGSDYTAAILAAELGARALEIWTDVDGFMTADPRVINSAYVINRLTFIEAMELCNFGAKVIYPPTIYPVFHCNIPIYIKNTFRPDLPGTLICAEKPAQDKGEKPIKGISSISDTSLVTISGLGMVGIVGVNARIFNALAENGVSVFMVSQASSENNTSFAVRSSDAPRAIEVLRNEFASELESGTISDIGLQENLATVAIVGENMRHHPGIAGKLFNTLGRNGINLIACAQGSLETNISFVIDSNNLRKTLNVIHDSFFLSETQKLNLFIVGIGNVGNRLISQICSQQKRLLKEKALEIKVVGIANSHHAVFDREGIDLTTYRTRLRNEGIPAGPTEVLESNAAWQNAELRPDGRMSFSSCRMALSFLSFFTSWSKYWSSPFSAAISRLARSQKASCILESISRLPLFGFPYRKTDFAGDVLNDEFLRFLAFGIGASFLRGISTACSGVQCSAGYFPQRRNQLSPHNKSGSRAGPSTVCFGFQGTPRKVSSL